MNSRGLFLARADSLMRKSMWEDLRRMLDGRFPPISKVDLELLRAFLARAEAPDEKKRETVRAHLNGAILYASGNSRAAELAQVGAGAEALGQPDIALLAYGELAKINSPARLQTLKRIYLLCEESGDATGMLKEEGKREDAVSLAKEISLLEVLEEERWFLEPIKQS